jgi:hypothetical protein
MSRSFSELAFTPRVKQLQQQHGSRRQYERMEQSAPPGSGSELGVSEETFIALRDSFYMASVRPYPRTIGTRLRGSARQQAIHLARQLAA